MLYSDTASPDDPTELSFAKGEVLDVLDKQGKWWQAKNSDGVSGSKFLLGTADATLIMIILVAPSNYLQII